jgi:cytochrome c oxidase assembly factor CtaG
MGSYMLNLNGVIQNLLLIVMGKPLDLLLWEKNTAGSLSQYILSGRSMLSTTLNPGTNFFIHITCLVASYVATNSACIVDDALVFCL